MKKIYQCTSSEENNILRLPTEKEFDGGIFLGDMMSDEELDKILERYDLEKEKFWNDFFNKHFGEKK